MKYICLRCNRTSVDGNLWCQEKFCPAEDSPVIFESGEWFGDIEIVDLLTVLRASAIYEARRGGEKVYLKVAHQGCQDKLKREAKLLADLARGSQHPMLPVLLPPYAQARLRDFPYGKTAVDGQTRYYCVFKYTAGDLLRTILLRTPQPWYQHIGWIILGLADAITLLHQAQRLHLCLSPDIILVRYDKQQIPRPLLLDLGIASDAQEILRNWDRRWAPPAYTAPELIEMKGKVGPGTDVYGLGMILYEMLEGHTAFEYGQLRDEEVYNNVLSVKPAGTGRTDLKYIPQIAERAVSKDYVARQKDVITFARELAAILPRLPREKKQFKINWRAVTIVVGAAMAISLLLVLAAI